MEIDDLVNTIEVLSEEQAVEVVARAEQLAEEQAEEMPRRKGARTPAPVVTEGADDAAAAEAGAGRAARPTLDDLFGSDESAAGAEAAGDQDAPPESGSAADGGDESDLTASDDSDEIRDLALASEQLPDQDGREVTSAPSDADQSETARIVTEAVEAGASHQEIVANEAGAGRNVPPLPPTEPFSTDEVEGRDSEMHQP
jgi:N utilization substance protein A